MSAFASAILVTRTASKVTAGGSILERMEAHPLAARSAMHATSHPLRRDELAAARLSMEGSASDIEAKVDDIAVPHHVLASFESHLTGFLRALLALARDVVVVGDDFGADESLLEIGVDH